jgi:hypothetical protein
LDRVFYRCDIYKENKEMVKPNEYIEVDIGSPKIPKIIKIGKGTQREEKREINNLIREYRYVFSWSYDDLKAYKGYIIQNTMPLKEDSKPFLKKLKKINPKLAPFI